MRIACVLVTHLRAKVEMSRQPHLKTKPVLIVDRNAARGRRTLVVDQFPRVLRMCVTAGHDVWSRPCLTAYADAVVLDADEPHYRRIFDQVLRSLQGVSDRVEAAELGTAYVRIDGLERLHRRRGPGRLGPVERCSRLPQAAPGRRGLEVPGLCGRQD